MGVQLVHELEKPRVRLLLQAVCFTMSLRVADMVGGVRVLVVGREMGMGAGPIACAGIVWVLLVKGWGLH